MRVLLIIENPVLTAGQLQRISNIFDNAGQVIFGVAVLAPVVGGVDRINILVVVLSIVTVLLCWVVSVWLAKKGESYEL